MKAFIRAVWYTPFANGCRVSREMKAKGVMAEVVKLLKGS